MARMWRDRTPRADGGVAAAADSSVAGARSETERRVAQQPLCTAEGLGTGSRVRLHTHAPSGAGHSRQERGATCVPTAARGRRAVRRVHSRAGCGLGTGGTLVFAAAGTGGANRSAPVGRAHSCPRLRCSPGRGLVGHAAALRGRRRCRRAFPRAAATPGARLQPAGSSPHSPWPCDGSRPAGCEAASHPGR